METLDNDVNIHSKQANGACNAVPMHENIREKIEQALRIDRFFYHFHLFKCNHFLIKFLRSCVSFDR